MTRPVPRSNCRRRPAVEGLEERRLLSLGFTSVRGVGVVGDRADLRANATATDAAGDVFVVGTLHGTADFGTDTRPVTLQNSGSFDLYAAKYSPTGALIWAVSTAGATSGSVCQGLGIAVDVQGNVVLTGSFSGNVNFDPGPGSFRMTSAGVGDAFVAKLDSAGRFLWAVDVPGTPGALDQGTAVAVDGAGTIYATGYFSATATFGATTLTSGGNADAFAMALAPSGRFLWAAATGGSATSATAGTGIAADGVGGVSVSGSFSGTVNFDPGPGVRTLTSAGSTDAFAWRLGSGGVLSWADRFGGTDFDQANAVAMDPSGNVYITGTFTGTVSFDAGQGRSTLTAGGTNDPFVCKLDSSGRLIWARSFVGNSGSSVGRGLALDGAGDVISTGDFSGSVAFGPDAGSSTRMSLGGTDVFVAVLDSSGNFLAVQAAGGEGFDAGFGLAVNASGTIAIAGRYTGPATFGGTTLPRLSPISIFVGALKFASDTTAPGIPALEAASDTGVLGDNLTASKQPVFDVIPAVAGNLVELLRDGRVVGSRTGPGAIADPGPVPDGLHLYAARQTDLSGRISPVGPSVAVTIDSTPPAAPSALTLLPADDTGVLGDGITSARRPHLVGAAEPGSTVQVLDASGSLVATANALANGTFSAQPGQPLADGPYRLSARATDAAGNVGPLGPGFLLTIDGTAPAAPSAMTLAAEDDTGVLGDGITSVRRPQLRGTAEAGARVQVLDGAGGVVASTIAGLNGSFSAPVLNTLIDGVYAFSARAIDAAGNVGPSSPVFLLTVDGTPPAAPSALTLAPADDTGLLGDGITSVRRPRLKGTAEPGARVQVLDAGGAEVAVAIAAADGTFIAQPTLPLADSLVILRPRATDAAGNVGPFGPALFLTIDTTPPIAPSAMTLLPADDTGVVGDGNTAVRRPHLIGTAEPGASVQVLDTSGAGIASAVAGGNGRFSAQVNTALADGLYQLTARATDAAGNVGPSGPTLSLTIDGTPPIAPSALLILATDDSGVIGDGITSIRRPRLTGTAEPGSTVQILDAGGTVVGVATVGGDGTFSAQPTRPLGDGLYRLAARATDAAGNLGPTGPSMALTIDGTPPSAPSSLTILAADDTGVLGDGVTTVRRPRLIGTAEPGATVQVVDRNGVVVASTVAAADGVFSAQPREALADGVYSLAARAIDAAGNVGAFSQAFALTILGTVLKAPDAPILAFADDTGVKGDNATVLRQPHLIGKVAPGLTVDLLEGKGKAVASAIAGADGSYSLQSPVVLNVGTRTWSVRVRDVAGNVSADGAPLALKILGTPGDFDGDGKADVSSYDPTTSIWTIQYSGGGSLSFAFGGPGDIPVPADYDGDGKTDIAVYRPGNSTFYILYSGGGVLVLPFGAPNLDVPVPADYDGDGKADIATYRPSTAEWSILYSAGGAKILSFGAPNVDLPIPADYDGDGKTDIATYRPSTAEWSILYSTGGARAFPFGAYNVDRPVPGDYDGDGKADLAVYRTTNSLWSILLSGGGARVFAFGAPGIDIPVPADYDGDGKTDVGIFRPPTADWAILQSGGGVQTPTVGQPGIGLPLILPPALRGLPSGPPAALQVASFVRAPAVFASQAITSRISHETPTQPAGNGHPPHLQAHGTTTHKRPSPPVQRVPRSVATPGARWPWIVPTSGVAVPRGARYRVGPRKFPAPPEGTGPTPR